MDLDPYEDDFRRGLHVLKRYAKHNGHACVPYHHRESSFRLGMWVSSRRTDYRLGRLPERVAALEALPGWSWWGHASRTPKRRRPRPVAKRRS